MSTLVVAALIQDKDGRILCAKRNQDKSQGGKWEFPGGKPEEGETLEGALMREIREELGIDIRVLRLFDQSITGDIELVAFSCELVAVKPSASTDHSELRWLKEEELSGLDWAEADKPALKKLLIPGC